jgi:serine/threonine protein kinase
MAPLEGPVAGSSSADAALSASSGAPATGSTSSGSKWKGRILKRFKLLDLLGQGSMGKVFRAEDITLRRHVALKVLPTRTKDGQRDHKIDQFVREARSAASIEHPNAVTVYEIGEAAGVHYIAMELVEGGNLEKLVKASGPMEIDRACQIAAEAAEALAAAHAQGIIHRDVKPSNLLLARNGRCKLADFGLARYDDPEDLRPRGECVGTPCYIAPELPLGQKATAQSDIYSLGCTLWFLLTGRPPFEARTKQDMMKMHVYAALPDLRERRDDVPERLVEAISRACAKNPTDRYESADQLAKVLRTFTIRTGGGSSGRLPTLTGTSASGSLPAWTPEASPSASSSNLGPHLSHTASHFGPIPPLSGPPEPQPAAGSLRSRLNSPLVWTGFGTVAAAVLIGLGVWIARGNSAAENGSTAAPSGARRTATGAETLPGSTQTGSNMLVNGNLEQAASDRAAPSGWFLAEKYQEAVRVVEEGGNRFVRITPRDEADTPHLDQKLDIDPAWTAVTVAARMRAADVRTTGNSPSDGRVAFDFRDAAGKGVGDWPPVPNLKHDSPWLDRQVTVPVPAGARTLHLRLSVLNATGTFDFDDVRVIPQIGSD